MLSGSFPLFPVREDSSQKFASLYFLCVFHVCVQLAFNRNHFCYGEVQDTVLVSLFSETKDFFCFLSDKRCHQKRGIFCIRYFSKTKSKPVEKKIHGDVFLFN